MQKIYNGDKPVEDGIQDKFNRYNFSKRIAETIIKRDGNDGLVIGLYGAWGEGKTSVLNFLEKELNKDDTIIIVNFNPWRFTNEDALILNFLKNISTALDKQLFNNKEKVGDFIKKFGSVTSIMGLDLSKIGESISDTELESLKNRVNEFLSDSGKKVVIIVDDIDRLDKNELFSLFKLVKLTGDFSNTYYILSFDDEMVAASIGERYASGDKNSGYNFLEKIIQVPLQIPKALSKDISTYTFELINKVFEEAELKFSDQEGQQLGYEISQYVLPKISTPRLAVRYTNSLAFIIPLLKGEVNSSDLILLEAIKVFYPLHYDFIKSNSEYFIETYDDFLRGDKVEEIKAHLEKLNAGLAKKETTNVTSLLTNLFPSLNEALNNHYIQGTETFLEKDKKIGSRKYFSRYFLYSVPNNEMSDVYFDTFLKSITERSAEENVSEIDNILTNVDQFEFLNRIGFAEDSLTWVAKTVLIELIIKIEDRFEHIKDAFNLGMNNPKAKAAISIYQLIKSHSNKDEQFEYAKKVVSKNTPFEFAMEILRWLKLGITKGDELFTGEQYLELNNILLLRALDECNEQNLNLFEKYNEQIFQLTYFWFVKDAKELDDYIKEILEANQLFVKTLLYKLTPIIYSSASTEPYRTDFKKENFETLYRYTDIENIYKKIIENFQSEIDKEEVRFYDMDEGQNEMNVLRQFIYWYNESKQS